MATVKHHKVVAALPAVLEPDAIYYVRAGQGHDVYVTNGSGMIVGYPANAALGLDGKVDKAEGQSLMTDAERAKLGGIEAGATANATDAQLRDRATHTGTQAIDTVSGLQAVLDEKIDTTERGVSGGVATLDEFARIPSSQLPSYVDEVLEFPTRDDFPATGEGGKIYIAVNQGTQANPTRQYRWTGSVYAEINPSPGTTDALAEGSTNLYFSEHRVRNTVLTGLNTAVSAAITAADTVLSALGKIQARLNQLGAAANANVQISPTDTTAGALMAVGAFNLGTANQATPLADIANLNETRFFRYNEAMVGRPSSGSGYGEGLYIAALSQDNGYGGALFFDYAMDDIAFRRKTAGVWWASVSLFHTGNFNPAAKQDKSAIVTTATSRTLSLADAWKYLRPNTSSAITLTIPANSSVALEIGTEITVRANGSITLAPASGVSISPPAGGSLQLTARMTVTLKKVYADTWDLIGQTVAA